MCGIIGSAAGENAVPALLEGLSRLEYRGYDSAGIAVMEGGALKRARSVGRVDMLRAKLLASPLAGSPGVAHTRWATHGAPTLENAHPIFSSDGRFAVVHNGIIENAAELRRSVLPPETVFASETDTEVVAALLSFYFRGDPLAALVKTLSRLKGAYALGILCTETPEVLYAAAEGSPLAVVRTQNGMLLSSDPAAVPGGTEVFRLAHREIAVLRGAEARFYNAAGDEIVKKPAPPGEPQPEDSKGGFSHYMRKEMDDQPRAVADTLGAYVRNGAFCAPLPAEAERTEDIVLVGCGSAYHAALAAKPLFERLADLPCRAEIASEFRYASPRLGSNTLAVFISQSGETADTLAGLRLAKERGASTLAAVNVPGSAIAAEADRLLLTRAGREVAVATTKAYAAQLAALYALALQLAEERGGLCAPEKEKYLSALFSLPEKIHAALAASDAPARALAPRLADAKTLFYIGRQTDLAAAEEGALKMKEITYLPCAALPAGELKHGTISLIEPGTPVLAAATDPLLLPKTAAALSEVKTRGAFTVAIAPEAFRAQLPADAFFPLPEIHPLFSCSLSVLPLQLLAYHTAVLLSRDIDKPRNLAKSVTVE